MTTREFLLELEKRKINLYSYDGRIYLSADKGLITDEIRSECGLHKEEILRLLNKNSEKKQNLIEKVPENIKVPLSYSQELFYILDQLSPNDNAYNIPVTYRLKGELNIQAIIKAFQAIVDHNSCLHTVYVKEGMDVYQKCLENCTITPHLFDISHLDVDKHEVAVSIARKIANISFDLQRDILLRLAIVKMGRNEHLLIFVTHHFGADGWSMGLIMDQICRYYNLLASNKEIPSISRNIEYRDYTYWQRNRIENHYYEKQCEYWKTILNKDIQRTEIPADLVTKSADLGMKGMIDKFVPIEVVNQIVRICSDKDATLFMYILTVLYILLFEYLHSNEIAINTMTSCRNDIEIEDMIGPFMNNLVILNRVEENDTFYHLLEHTKRAVIGAFENQEIPFQRVLSELKIKRNGTQDPFTAIMMILHNSPMEQKELKGIDAQTESLYSSSADEDIKFDLWQMKKGLYVSLEYNTAKYSKDMMENLIDNFMHICKVTALSPDKNIQFYHTVPSTYLESIYCKINKNYLSLNHASFHQLLEDSITHNAQKAALIMNDQKMTYEELNIQMNQTACYLKSIGVVKNAVIGVYMQKGIQFVVAVLAIQKIGAIWVPMNPNDPRERNDYIVSCVDMKFILQESNNHVNFNVPMIDMAEQKHCIESMSSDFPWEECKESDVAYILFTSGSTGKPKGVQGLYRGLINRTLWMIKKYPFHKNEVVSWTAKITFVDTVWQMLGTLLSGATCAIVPDDVIKDVTTLVDYLKNKNVTRIVLVPSLMNVMLEYYPKLSQILTSLKYCMTSGEELSSGLARKMKMAMPDQLLINIYGSSEVSADVLFYEIDDINDNCMRIPIGKPIANSVVYILDDKKRKVLPGTIGELYIGGTCLSGGYIYANERTEDKFVANPYVSEDQQPILFQTGDVGRIRHDGNIEYLGRTDRQVKIRGMRVEIDEIEVVINKYTGVHQAIVIDKNDPLGLKHLIAVIQPDRNETELNIKDLERYLKNYLPEYMIPSYYSVMPEIPLLANGKIDRKKLIQDTKLDVEYLHKEFVAPKTYMEDWLSDLWKEVLECDYVSLYDEFFELGGNSISIMRLLHRINQGLQLSLQVYDIVKTKSLEEMSKIIMTEFINNIDEQRMEEVLYQVERMNG